MGNGKNHFGKGLAIYAVAFGFMLAAFVLMSLVAYCVPAASVKSNADASRLIIKQEGKRPGYNYYLRKDNFTDDLMLNLAETGIGEYDDPFMQTFTNYFTVDSAISNLVDARDIKTYRGEYVINYSRYWHGYLLPLRLMLVVTDLRRIRIVNIIILSLLLAAAGFLIWRRISPKAAAMFVLSVAVVAVPLVPLCMQFSTCFYIMLASVIFILISPYLTSDNFNLALILFFTGGITSFLDLLTVPVITLGFPLAIGFLSHKKTYGLKAILACSLSWLAGYGGIWAAKWILSTLITDNNIIADAMTQVSFRTFETEDVASVMRVLLKYDVAGLILTLAAGALCLCFRKSKAVLKKYLYLVIIGCFPLLWYAVLQNHSLTHFWFTWRSLSLTLFCWTTYCLYVIDFKALSRWRPIYKT